MMHLFWSLCCLTGADYATIHLLQTLLTCFLPMGVLLMWMMGLVRCFILTFGVHVVSQRSNLPSWLQGGPLFIFFTVLSLLFPFYVTLGDLLSIQTSMELMHVWGRADLFLGSYALTLLSAVTWTQLCLSSEDAKEESGSLMRLIALLRPYGGRFLIMGIFLMLSVWGEMAVPYYMGRISDWMQNKEEPSVFGYTVRLMVLITVCSALTEFICDYIYLPTMSLVHIQTQEQILRSVLKQEVAFFDTVPTGDIISCVTADITEMSESLNGNLNMLIWHAMRVVFLVIYMVTLSPKLTLFCLLCLLIIILVPQLSGAYYQKLAKQIQQSLSKVNQAALDTFSNIKTVRSFANEEGECLRFEARLEDASQLQKTESLAHMFTTIADCFSGLALKVGILYFGGRLVLRGEVSGGELVSFVLYELEFTEAVESLLQVYPHVRKAVGSSEKIFVYMDRKPQTPLPGSHQPAELQGHVQFQDVTFSYPKCQKMPALQDVSFELLPGQVTALVGPCDAGKSTVVHLLLKFYEPQKGQILLDGKPISEYNNKYFRRKVSVVSQEPILTARSIKDNISYGLGKVPVGLVKKAAIAASADCFISEKVDGYNTGAGEKGGLLSGGQKQRVALARALLRDPKVLILDDATSALDTETQLKIQSTVLNNPNKRTILLISHRMNVLEKADHILVMEGGHIKESGKHQELLDKRGSYWKLWEKQHSTFQSDTVTIEQN